MAVLSAMRHRPPASAMQHPPLRDRAAGERAEAPATGFGACRACTDQAPCPACDASQAQLGAPVRLARASVGPPEAWPSGTIHGPRDYLSRRLSSRSAGVSLRLGASDAPHEAEADQVAHALTGPEPHAHAAGQLHPSDASARRASGSDELAEERAVSPEAVQTISALPGTGTPLPENERAYFEPRFGR